MPMAFWAAQTTAALDLLGVRQDYPHLNPTLPPMLLLLVSKRPTAFVLSGAIVVFSHLFVVLTSPDLAVPSSLTGMLPLKMPVISMLIDMYMDWFGCDFQELISYLEVLRSMDSSMWPSSSDDDVWRREYSVQDVVTGE
jgi:hypothetical protein